MPDKFLIDRNGRVAAAYVGMIEKEKMDKNIPAFIGRKMNQPAQKCARTSFLCNAETNEGAARTRRSYRPQRRIETRAVVLPLRNFGLVFAALIFTTTVFLGDQHNQRQDQGKFGTVHSRSCSASVKKEFVRGVALLHSFAFQSAETNIPPSCER
jgi:hypothetical protein